MATWKLKVLMITHPTMIMIMIILQWSQVRRQHKVKIVTIVIRVVVTIMLMFGEHIVISTSAQQVDVAAERILRLIIAMIISVITIVAIVRRRVVAIIALTINVL